jgi:hypothetical protein
VTIRVRVDWRLDPMRGRVRPTVDILKSCGFSCGQE